jgi:hypothetical protein
MDHGCAAPYATKQGGEGAIGSVAPRAKAQKPHGHRPPPTHQKYTSGSPQKLPHRHESRSAPAPDRPRSQCRWQTGPVCSARDTGAIIKWVKSRQTPVPSTRVSIAEVLLSDVLERNFTRLITQSRIALHAAVPMCKVPELVERKPQKPIRLAIAAGVKVGQHLARQVGHGDLPQLIRLALKVIQVHRGGVARGQWAAHGLEPQVACVRVGVGIEHLRQRLTDVQRLRHHSLPRSLCGVNAQNEVTTWRVNVVAKFDRKLKSDHGGAQCKCHRRRAAVAVTARGRPPCIVRPARSADPPLFLRGYCGSTPASLAVFWNFWISARTKRAKSAVSMA